MRAFLPLLILLLVAGTALAETYNTPTIDGTVNIDPDDLGVGPATTRALLRSAV